MELKLIKKEDPQPQTKEDLMHARNQIDLLIRNNEFAAVNERLNESLHKVRELTESLSTIQNVLNHAWKRAEQLGVELAEIRAFTHKKG